CWCSSTDSKTDILDSMAPEKASEETSTSTIARSEAQVLERLPFDAPLFTQGIHVAAPRAVPAGTGQNREAGMFTLPAASDAARQHVRNDSAVFGAGIAQYNSAEGPVIWQLSWDSGEAYKYNAESYELLDTVSYPGEGWGLCSLDD